MAIDFGEKARRTIFKHSEEFNQGGGAIRKGAGTFVVALDGSGDFSSIQEAIDALPSTGGVVYIKEGTYNISKTITILKSNISLIGAGNSTILFLVAGVHSDLLKIGNGTTTLEGIKIKDLKIDGNGANNATGTNSGIYFLGGAANLITKCVISNCEIINADWSNLRTDYMENSLIIDNIAVSTTVTHSFYLQRTNQVRISGNVIDTGGNGMTFTNNTLNSIIIGNIISNTTAYGMGETALVNCVVSNNMVTNAGTNGFEIGVGNTTMTGNMATDCGDAGFYIYGTGEFTLSSNVAESNTEHGFEIAGGGDNSTIIGNVAKNNDVGNTSSFDGIFLTAGLDNCSFTGNNCMGNDRYGINVSDATCDKNVLVANVCLNNTTGAINDVGTGTEAAHNIIA